MRIQTQGMSRRTFLGAAGVGAASAALAGLVGCGRASTPATTASTSAATSSAEPEKLTFVLDYTPNTNHTGIYVAITKGYYRERNLEIEVVQPPEDGSDALVGTGKAQVGMGYQDVMANYLGSSDPLPVTAIAATIQHNTSGIMSRKGDGITRPKGMENKRYATWDQDAEKAIVKSVVETDGGDFSKIKLVPSNSSDEVTGLKANEFDSVWVYEAWAVQNAKVQHFAYDYFAFRDIDSVFDFYTPVVIANNDFLSKKPDVARAFLAATKKGYEYVQDHPEESAKILCDAAPEIDSKLALQSQKFLADKYTADASNWGIIDSARWGAFYRWMNEQKLTPVAIDEKAGFSMDYLG